MDSLEEIDNLTLDDILHPQCNLDKLLEEIKNLINIKKEIEKQSFKLLDNKLIIDEINKSILFHISNDNIIYLIIERINRNKEYIDSCKKDLILYAKNQEYFYDILFNKVKSEDQNIKDLRREYIRIYYDTHYK